jgi:hypothetical protein
VHVAAVNAPSPRGNYHCPRCKKPASDDDGHWAVHCSLLAKDLLTKQFCGKSQVLAMSK